PAWDAFYVPFLALTALALFQPLNNLIHPEWTRYRSLSRAATGGLMAALLVVSPRIGDWIVAASPSSASVDHLALIRAMTVWIGRLCDLIIVVAVVTSVLELRRAFRGTADAPGIRRASNGGSVAASS